MPTSEPGAKEEIVSPTRAVPRGPLATITRIRTFRALQSRDCRLLWLGQCGYSGAVWGESIARGWLVYDMTNSALLLGLVGMLRSLPASRLSHPS